MYNPNITTKGYNTFPVILQSI